MTPPFTSRALPSRLRRAAGLAALLGATWLAGCSTVGPDYQRPEMPQPLPQSWRFDAGEAANVTNEAWWEAFGDPDLDDLIKRAIDGNRDLLMATYRIEQFDARVQISSAAKYPQVGYDGGFERKQRSQEQPALLTPGRDPSYNNVGIEATVNWEINVWGKIKRSNELARAQLLASEQARRAVMLKLVTGVATSYVQLLALDDQLASTNQVLQNRLQWLGLVEARYEGGLTTLLAVQRARAEVEDIRAALPEIERQIATVEDSLSNLLGTNPGAVKRGRLDHLKLPPVPKGVPSDVLLRRPDVAAAEQNLVAANARIGIAKSEYLPTVSLTGALGLASDDLRWLLAKTARSGDFSRGLAGTLFSGGRIEGDVRQAEAQQREMTQAYLQTIQTALQETNDALVARVKTGEIVQAQARQIAALRDVVRVARLRYEGGQSTLVDVLDAERQVFAGQNQQAQGLREQYAALVSVYKAMGGGWMVAQDKLRGRVEPSDVPPPPEGPSASDLKAP